MKKAKIECDNQLNITKHSAIYKALNSTQETMIPVSLGISGYYNGFLPNKWLGGFLGASVGVLEEYLISANYITTRYLSSMFVGSTLAISSLSIYGHKVSPHQKAMIGIVGGIAGLASSMGVLQNNSDLVNYAAYSMIGYGTGGITGAVINSASYFTDKYLEENHYTNGSFLTTTAMVASTTKAILPKVQSYLGVYPRSPA